MALTQKAGGSQSAALYVETGQRLPTVATIARMAAALSVSAAWLAFGYGELTSSAQTQSCDGMGARLRAVRDEQAQTKASLARDTGLNAGTIAGIEKGGQAGIDTIETLAKALRVSAAWLAYGIGDRELPARRRSRPAASV